MHCGGVQEIVQEPVWRVLPGLLLRAWGGKRSGLLELVEVMDLTIVFPDCICIS